MWRPAYSSCAKRVGEHLEPDMLDGDLVTRLREGVDLVERRTKSRTSG
jgi:hypothetical protein